MSNRNHTYYKTPELHGSISYLNNEMKNEIIEKIYEKYIKEISIDVHNPDYINTIGSDVDLDTLNSLNTLNALNNNLNFIISKINTNNQSEVEMKYEESQNFIKKYT
jgi:hypothetical protein